MTSTSKDYDHRQDLTPEQAALAAGVSVTTIWRWKRGGHVKSRRVLRRVLFNRDEVIAVAAEMRKAQTHQR